MQAGVNFTLHTAGWLEGGLAIGYEKFILDEDQASMASKYIEGVDVSKNGLALAGMIGAHSGNLAEAVWRTGAAEQQHLRPVGGKRRTRPGAGSQCPLEAAPGRVPG